MKNIIPARSGAENVTSINPRAQHVSRFSSAAASGSRPSSGRRGADEDQGQQATPAAPRRHGNEAAAPPPPSTEQDVGRLESVEVTRPIGDLGGGQVRSLSRWPTADGSSTARVPRRKPSEPWLAAGHAPAPAPPSPRSGPATDDPARACIQEEEHTQGDTLDDESGIDDREHPHVEERAGRGSAGAPAVPPSSRAPSCSG